MVIQLGGNAGSMHQESPLLAQNHRFMLLHSASMFYDIRQNEYFNKLKNSKDHCESANILGYLGKIDSKDLFEDYTKRLDKS